MTDTTSELQSINDRLRVKVGTYLSIPKCVGSPGLIEEACEACSIVLVQTLGIKHKMLCEAAVLQQVERPVPKGSAVHVKIVDFFAVCHRYYTALKLCL